MKLIALPSKLSFPVILQVGNVGIGEISNGNKLGIVT